MELEKLRKSSEQEMAKEIAKLREKLIQLQSEAAMHKLKNLRSLRAARKSLAVALTVQNEQAIIRETNNE